MNIDQLRNKFLSFFEARGHAIIPSASLVPENDPSSLFTTAGMQPLVPYLLGQKHPKGVRLVNSQKCVRTGDIEDVGDNRHLTFFEMLGNWSLGDYFKKESIEWSMEFLTSTKEGLGLDPNRLYVTVFKGEQGIPRDEEAIEIWKEVFQSHGIITDVSDDEMIYGNKRIIPLGVEDNFWIAGNTGPCGGDTEIFYDTRPEEGAFVGTFTENVNSFRLIEIWNNVFMEFNKTQDGTYIPLERKNVDTGMGLERTVAVINSQSNVFQGEVFQNIFHEIVRHIHGGISRDQSSHYNDEEELSLRIISDHLRTSVFMIADGVFPSNSEQGYVLRRLLRRSIRHANKIGVTPFTLAEIALNSIVNQYKVVYPELNQYSQLIHDEIYKEEEKFRNTLERGLKEFSKIKGDVSGSQAFNLYQSYGFPLEVIQELAREKHYNVDVEVFHSLLQDHQEKSRVGAEKKFKGGLADTDEMSIRYHTATHLLNAALRKIIGGHVFQKGSNITSERLRFDFSHHQKITDEEKKSIEALVNSWIQLDMLVTCEVMKKEDAEKRGAIGVFGDTYGDEVSVYSIVNENDVISMEFCGGPHVAHTGILGTFSIIKEESVSSGVRRIKAVLS
jgi:alanyl-tRNA synthetase